MLLLPETGTEKKKDGSLFTWTILLGEVSWRFLEKKTWECKICVFWDNNWEPSLPVFTDKGRLQHLSQTQFLCINYTIHYNYYYNYNTHKSPETVPLTEIAQSLIHHDSVHFFLRTKFLSGTKSKLVVMLFWMLSRNGPKSESRQFKDWRVPRDQDKPSLRAVHIGAGNQEVIRKCPKQPKHFFCWRLKLVLKYQQMTSKPAGSSQKNPNLSEPVYTRTVEDMKDFYNLQGWKKETCYIDQI